MQCGGKLLPSWEQGGLGPRQDERGRGGQTDGRVLGAAVPALPLRLQVRAGARGSPGAGLPGVPGPANPWGRAADRGHGARGQRAGRVTVCGDDAFAGGDEKASDGVYAALGASGQWIRRSGAV